ncbi:MAG: GNAT family N-acetyltransferase [bacterium]|nr:GNAT family N-acetyltransferase [bacterium]
MTLETPEKTLEGNLLVRPVRMDDFDAALKLFNLCTKLEIGVETNTGEELRNEWNTPNWNMETSTRGVFTPEGEMVGYVEVFDIREVPVRPNIWGRVHPDYRGRGIGGMLLDWGVERARQAIDRCPPDARVVVASWLHDSAHDAEALFASRGFFTERGSYQMRIEMTEAPPAPVWPEGITVTTLEAFKDDKAVLRAHLDAFQDHRGFVQEPFEVAYERWNHWMLKDEHFDPSLWFLAMDGEEIAGYSICIAKAWDDPEKGFVDILGVRRAYRRHGMGLALLHHTFGEFWKRGIKKVGLGVDATSITNAVALYERAGMHVFRRYNTYELELRPGIEYSTQ